MKGKDRIDETKEGKKKRERIVKEGEKARYREKQDSKK